MGEMASLWGYAEHGDMDQLGQKLLYTSLELEKLKSEANEEMTKSKEYINHLIQLLKCAIEERDEARDQLEKLIITSSSTAAAAEEMFPAIPHFHGGGDSPLLKQGKANSSITESNSLSETQNYHSPAVDSFFDAALSPPLPPEISSFPSINIDRGSLIVENLSKGRVLPRKGMLLQAVLEAGPLLQTLMVAGPLPRWRNPPQMQPFQIPAVAMKGGEVAQKPQLGWRQQSSSQYCYSNVPILSKFGDVNNYGTNCLNNASLMSSSNGCFRLPKRQRFC